MSFVRVEGGGHAGRVNLPRSRRGGFIETALPRGANGHAGLRGPTFVTQ